MCAYSLDRNVPIDEITDQAVPFAVSSLPSCIRSPLQNFTLYFACDDTCCAMECCQRDIQMTIMSVRLLVLL